MNVYRSCFMLLLASLLFSGSAMAAPPAAQASPRQTRAVPAAEYDKAVVDFKKAFAAAEEARQRLALIRPAEGKPDPLDCYWHPWHPGCQDIWTTLERERGPELSAVMEQHLLVPGEGSGAQYKTNPWKGGAIGWLVGTALDYAWDVGVCLYKADGPHGGGLEGPDGMKKFGNCFVKPGIAQGPGGRYVVSDSALPDSFATDTALELEPQEVAIPKGEVWGQLREAQAKAYKAAPSANKTTAACVEPADGQLAWFPLDDGASPLSIELIAGARGQRKNGPQPTAGMVGGALQFDGGDDFVEMPGPQAAAYNIGTGDLSFEAWVRTGPQDNRRGVRVLVEKRQPNPLRGYSFFLYNGRPGVQLADPSGYSNYIASFEVPADGRWHLVSATVRRSKLTPPGGQFYLDGAPAGQPFDAANRPGDLANSAPLRLGSTTLAARPESVFHGALDEVGVFNRALAAEEVKRIHGAGAAGRCQYAAAEAMVTVHVHMKCDNGKETTMVVTGLGTALDARDWALSNCNHKVVVTASW